MLEEWSPDANEAWQVVWQLSCISQEGTRWERSRQPGKQSLPILKEL